MKNFLWICLTLLLLPSQLLAQSSELFRPAPSFQSSDRIVAATLFHWYASTGGQLSGPWLPLEGRPNWTGLTPWWKTQIKQAMMANIDVFYVHLIDDAEIRRELFFAALHELRAEGYDVPKVAPFLDPLITWFNEPNVDLATVAGKDTMVQQYVRFYTQYFQRNPDAYAADYLAKMDEKLILSTWHLFLNFDNVSQFTRVDLENRLATKFAGRPAFQQGIYMITPALNNPTFTFTDERVPLFEINTYFQSHTFNSRKTLQIKAGYWDQNVRTPGDFLPRAGGIHYTNAWSQVDTTFNLVYVESWNEYDEGTGIYAAQPDTNYLINNNPNTDTWSTTGDPYEYIRTTAAGAAVYNTRPEFSSLFLANDLPDTLASGMPQPVQITVRNEGDFSWTQAAGITLQQLSSDPVQLTLQGGTLDDTQNEIPIYGGIFRGRPVTFAATVTAPAQPGTYPTHWQMHLNGQPFGDTLVHTVHIQLGTAIAPPQAWALTISPNPTRNQVLLDWQGPKADQVVVLNLQGQTVATYPRVSPGTSLTLPQAAGIYLLQITLKGQVYTQQVVKQ
jgi:hypothetical protein